MTRMKVVVFKLVFVVLTLAFATAKHEAVTSKPSSSGVAMNVLSKCPQSKCLVR